MNELKLQMNDILNVVLLPGTISKVKEKKLREEFEEFMGVVHQ